MLKASVIHPEILSVLSVAGHGSQVLIADGDYPVATEKGINAKVVHLNLVPGKLQTTEVLEALLQIMPIEEAKVMDVPQGMERPKIWDEYRRILREHEVDFHMEPIERFSFYDKVSQKSTALIIQTGETRDYANLLLTMGSLW